MSESLFSELVEGQEIEIAPHKITPDYKHVLGYEGSVDLSQLRSLEVKKVSFLNLRNSRQFSYTNRGLVEDIAKGKLRHKLTRYTEDPEVLKRIKMIDELGGLEPENLTVLPKTMFHSGPSLFRGGWREILDMPKDKVESMVKNGVYGRENGVTYLTDSLRIAIAHGVPGLIGGSGLLEKHPEARLLLMTIDTEKLLNIRNVFIDPESLAMTDEFWHTFVVHKGIPVESVTKMQLFKYLRTKK